MISNIQPKIPVYRLRRSEVERRLHTSVLNGISQSQAEERQKSYGFNELLHVRQSWYRMVLRHSIGPFTLIFLLGAVLSSAVQAWIEAGVMSLISISSASFGVLYERFSTRRDANTLSTSRVVEVIRDGASVHIAARELVPGDVCVLHANDYVPADIRITEARGLRTDEYVLNGKFRSVEKLPTALSVDADIADRRNMVFAGTVITHGVARGIVTDTGSATVLGGIIGKIEETRRYHTPLQDRLQTMGIVLVAGFIAMSGMLFGAGLILKVPIKEIYQLILILIVCATPIGIIITLGITLCITILQLRARNGDIRRISILEILGNASMVCLDKTGTLTTGKLALKRILGVDQSWSVKDGGEDLIEAVQYDNRLNLLFAATLCDSGALHAEEEQKIGSSMEQALMRTAKEAQIDVRELCNTYPLRDTITFCSDKKYSASLHDDGPRPGRIAFAVGAPDVLLSRCSYVYSVEGDDQKLKDAVYQQLISRIHDAALEGKRLLAVVKRKYSAHKRALEDADIHDMTFVGILVLEDSIRTGAECAIRGMRDNGVRSMLLTGEHSGTTQRIAQDIGIAQNATQITHGYEIAAMSDDRLSRILPSVAAVARIDPVQKERIVRILQERGEIVAVLGDGADDAMALSRADIGIATGLATDRVRYTSDLTIRTGGVIALSRIIREGRRIREAIRAIISYMVSTNVAALMLIVGALLTNMPIPFTLMMILWIIVITDGAMGIALGVEKEETRLKGSRPTKRNSIFRKRDSLMIVISGVALLLPLFIVFGWALYDSGDRAVAHTAVFVALAVAKIISAYSFRSLDRSMFSLRPFGNMWLVGVMLISFVLVVTAVAWSPLQSLLSTVPLTPVQWGVVLIAAFLAALGVEARKLLRTRILLRIR